MMLFWLASIYDFLTGTSKSYVNHSLPERPDFYRSIHLQKAHLRGESLSTVIFCMVSPHTPHPMPRKAPPPPPLDRYTIGIEGPFD